ncbi:MAG TPA: hypothetical protein P5179_10290, partial [Candidatus Latescibacteria bacterium]|nr:hypothetical protein [Candidatus Latescibacterota bacterium]
VVNFHLTAREKPPFFTTPVDLDSRLRGNDSSCRRGVQFASCTKANFGISCCASIASRAFPDSLRAQSAAGTQNHSCGTSDIRHFHRLSHPRALRSRFVPVSRCTQAVIPAGPTDPNA